MVLHSEEWEAWLGVLHFLNRKFKMAIIDLTLTMVRLCLFKLISNSLDWGTAFFPSVDQASRVISHTYNDYYKERRKQMNRCLMRNFTLLASLFFFFLRGSVYLLNSNYLCLSSLAGLATIEFNQSIEQCH